MSYGANGLSACTAGTPGPDPDRISQVHYLADDHVQSVVNALGTAQQTTDQSYTYTNNGQVASVSDGKGNTTGYVYDGFDRVLTVNWPTWTVLSTRVIRARAFSALP